MYLVSHTLCYTKIRTSLQSSPKVVETPMQWQGVIAMLPGYNNIARGRRRGRGRDEGRRIFQSVSGFLSEIVAYQRARKTWRAHWVRQSKTNGQYQAFPAPLPHRDWLWGPFRTHGELAQGVSLTMRPTTTTSPLCFFSPQWPETCAKPVRNFWPVLRNVFKNSARYTRAIMALDIYIYNTDDIYDRYDRGVYYIWDMKDLESLESTQGKLQGDRPSPETPCWSQSNLRVPTRVNDVDWLSSL